MRRSALVVLAALLAACGDSAAPLADADQAEFITVRRAWLPGERDSTIARIKRDRTFSLPWVGDISDEADRIYADLDSVTVMVANPDFGIAAANQAGLVLAPRFATNWDIAGVDVRNVNVEANPDDSTHWIGVFWANPADATWKGIALGAANTNPATTTFPQTKVNTDAFEASASKTGAGAAEFRTATATLWRGTGGAGGPNNTLQITSAAYGAAQTVTSGPFLGGTVAVGSMTGRMRTITLTRSSGSSAPTSFNVDLNFTGTAITAIRFVCVFRTPCTTNVPILEGEGSPQ